MPFCDVMRLFEYWSDCPPVHLMVRGYLGYEKPKPMEPQDTRHALQVLSGKGSAAKISQASERVKLMAESVRNIKRGR